MIRKFINVLIQRLGRKGYEIDPALSTISMIFFLSEKIKCLIRGFWLKLFIRRSKGLIFLGKNCKITNRHLIHLFGTTIIGDNVEINALSKRGISIGSNFSIHRNSIIECTGVLSNLGEGLVIGNNVGIAQNCFIQVRGKVTIGNNVIFGPNVSVFSENHLFDDLEQPVSVQGVSRKGINIEDGVWVGTRSVILDGVTVGKNSIIAAGSIVNRDVPSYSIVGGVPAKVIKSRRDNK